MPKRAPRSPVAVLVPSPTILAPSVAPAPPVTIRTAKTNAHEALVKRAARWLESSKCRIVFVGGTMQTVEQPDVFAWDDAFTTVLVEVKASRADFLRDRGKAWRRTPELGMGVLRWFFAPPGVIQCDELPLDWGLAEPSRGVVCRRVQPTRQKSNRHAEQRLLLQLAVEQKRALDTLYRAWRRDGR